MPHAVPLAKSSGAGGQQSYSLRDAGVSHRRTLHRRDTGRGEGPHGSLLLRPATRPNCHEPGEARSDVLLASPGTNVPGVDGEGGAADVARSVTLRFETRRPF